MLAIQRRFLFREGAEPCGEAAQLGWPWGEVLTQCGTQALRPLQHVCVAQGWLRTAETRGDVLLAAPPGAGKGLAAVLCAAGWLAAGRRVLWIAAENGGAARRAELLRRALAHLTTQVACPAETWDCVGNDETAHAGLTDLACADVSVLTQRQALGQLRRSGAGLADAGLVVVEDLELLGEPRRGPQFALLLRLLRESPYVERILGLCGAPVSAELAQAWGGERHEDFSGALPLCEGVFDVHSGHLRWRERWPGAGAIDEGYDTPWDASAWAAALRNGKAAAEEAGPPGCAAPELLAGFFAAALAAAQQGEIALLIAPSRGLARAWGAALAAAREYVQIDGTAAKAACGLSVNEPCADHTLLGETLKRGVALLHGDLETVARARLRATLRAWDDAACGGPPIIICTPGMDAGELLNALPCVVQRRITLLLWPWEFRGNDEAGEGRAVRWTALGSASYWRALGLLNGIGAAANVLLPAAGSAQAERLWRNYASASQPQAGLPHWERAAAADALLSLVAAAPRSPQNAAEGLRAFVQTCGGDPTASADETHSVAACAACETAGLIRLQAESGTLAVTEWGRIAARHALPAGLAGELRREAHALVVALAAVAKFAPDAYEPLPAIWWLALLLPEEWPGTAARFDGGYGARYLAAYARALESCAPWPERVRALLTRRGGPAARERLALEAGWRVAAWISEEETPEVEARTGWHAGQLARAARRLAWLARATADLLPALGATPAQAQAWRRLAGRLEWGCCDAAAELAAVRHPGLGRSARHALARDGLDTPTALVQAGAEVLAQRLGDAALARQVWRAARRLAGAVAAEGPVMLLAPAHDTKCTKQKSLNTAAQQPAQPAGPLLVISLTSPGIVQLAGREVALAPKPFDMLVELARAPGEVCTRAALYNALWPDREPDGDGPQSGPDDQQLDAHRRGLDAALRAGLKTGMKAAQPLIQVVRGHGFRLALAAAEVELRR